MQEDQVASNGCFILVRMSRDGRYYQTDLHLPDNLSTRTRSTLSRQAAWIEVRRNEGQLTVSKCERPQNWQGHTQTVFRLTAEEYLRIKGKLLRPQLVKSGAYRQNAWLCAGEGYDQDWRRICELLGYDWQKVDRETLRAKLIDLAKGDTSKCRHYGGPTEPDRVMFGRQWLEQIGIALYRKREKKKGKRPRPSHPAEVSFI